MFIVCCLSCVVCCVVVCCLLIVVSCVLLVVRCVGFGTFGLLVFLSVFCVLCLVFGV